MENAKKGGEYAKTGYEKASETFSTIGTKFNEARESDAAKSASQFASSAASGIATGASTVGSALKTGYESETAKNARNSLMAGGSALISGVSSWFGSSTPAQPVEQPMVNIPSPPNNQIQA
jgi:hypothetical protein